MNNTFENAVTPEVWCERLRSQGAEVSARVLRAKARSCGHYYALGRVMLLSAEHVEAILSAEGAQVRRGGQTARSWSHAK
ncbi:hypothetical protein DT23_15095 [Thioclava indica]|uniref:Uncharacterized protein n=1 Tax=Thioclava indica TaxID=1353528 RepID=A0A074JQP0_9RHOB|nr:hypothetical protein DT23_15095 [Thioclava indica]